MISLAAESIAMEPASQIGDSGVIAMGQGDMGDTERAKAESPVLADFDDSARRNGYDPLLARSFVRTEAVVYAIQPADGGEIRFVETEAYEELTAEAGGYVDVPDVPVPLDDEASLLTLSDEVAAKIGLSVGTFATADDFAASLGYTVTATLQPSGGERVIGFLSSFTVRGLLMTVLFLSVYASFQAPGTGVPEVLAVVLLTVIFGVPMLTGFAEWWEIGLVLVGIGLLAVEVFLLPGFGVFGFLGLTSVVAGLALSFVGPIFIPSLPELPAGFGVDWNRFGRGLLASLGAAVVSLLLWAWLARFLPTLPYANKLLLQDEPPTPEEVARQANWPLVGSTGIAASDLRPGGMARFAITEAPGDTTTIDVVSDRGFVGTGTELNVVEVRGSRVVVRPMGRKVDA
jgi:membrane-bound serine protease (ClpP class)